MTPRGTWLRDLAKPGAGAPADGLVTVAGGAWRGGDPAAVGVLEKAAHYGADYVFFRAASATQPVSAEALVYVDDGQSDEAFAALHRRLWSWGGVPLVYRKTRGRVDLLRCAHQPDFAGRDGQVRYHAFSTLDLMAEIDRKVDVDPWWDASMLRAGSLWDDPAVCEELLSADKAAQHGLVRAIADRDKELAGERVLPIHLRRRLLVLSLLIAYLEDRGVLGAEVFARYKPGAGSFFEVLGDGRALVALLADLETRFNGDVFTLSEHDQTRVLESKQLGRFAALVEGRTEGSGQMSLWRLYSFRDLPVELISHVYQHFVKDDDSAVYTPPFLVRLMLAEALSWERLDRMAERDEAVLDPSCGSGVFLVEAYKRLIAHWRHGHGWARPDVDTLRRLLGRVRGVDLNPDAIELAAFSLCLALCEALDTEALKASTRLFPKLRGVSLHESCFFTAKSAGALGDDIGAVLGNPPFESRLTTRGAEESYEAYNRKHGKLPDKQVAYLFLHESLELLRPGGVLCLLQQYNLLYNKGAAAFRRRLFERWDVREVLDFVSIRGLFGKGSADTKVVALVAEAAAPPPGRKVLHATFRRTGRVVAKRGFDLDYYDLHWLTRDQLLDDAPVWRGDLFGGGRVIDFVARLRSMRTLGQYADSRKWDSGEGFIAGGSRVNPNRSADHVVGKRFLPSTALTAGGADESQITIVEERRIEEPRSKRRFTAPMLLIREHMDLYNDLVPSGYLTYPDQIVGFCAPRSDAAQLRQVKAWLDAEIRPLRAYVAATSSKVQKATVIMDADIKALPYPPSGTLDLSPNERIVADDIVDYYCDFIRLGQKSAMLRRCTDAELVDFCEVYTRQVNAFYRGLRALAPYRWPGAVCQPFVFGAGEVDWSGAEDLKGRLARLLEERHDEALLVHRVARIFDGPFIFLLKPDRLRYWLRSAALRDADETLAELHAQGL
jgi:hypothetical protein